MAVNRERQKIWVNTYRSVDLEYCTLESVKAEIESLILEFGANARIDRYEYPYDPNYGYSMNVFIEREETDVEMIARIAEEERRATIQEERDRNSYEALKKKFEGKGI